MHGGWEATITYHWASVDLVGAYIYLIYTNNVCECIRIISITVGLPKQNVFFREILFFNDNFEPVYETGTHVHTC